MHTKKHDGFFDEETSETKAEKDLLGMLGTYDKPVAANLEVGSKASGKILKISDQYAFVEIGGKNEAVVELSELTKEDGTCSVAAGDVFEGYVVSLKNGITLSKKLSSKAAGNDSSMSDIIDAMKSKIPVEGKVTGINKGGFNVKVMGQKAFCPISQMDLKRVEDPNVFLNKSLTFVIARVTEGGRNIVVSRLPLLEADMGQILDRLASSMEAKTVAPGTISRIMPYGLFVDLGGFEGLVHISEVSWERSQDLSKTFEPGQKVDCLVLGIERREPLRQSKISLSIKQIYANPWTTVATVFAPGQTVQGKITRLATFGAFVQLVPGVEGLIHISEMSWEKRIRHPGDVVAEGQEVTVTILRVDQDKREISCSLKDAANDPWNGIEERFAAGSAVQGTVEQNTKFGFFVNLAEGITGLLPFGNIAQEKKESIKVGAPLDVTIESVDLERRRISLSYGKADERQHATEVKQYISAQKQQKSEPADTEFGEALKLALQKKQQ
ncbi:MAG TPA: S1 RNA-binding domain-containing protein [Chitinivibrionales bacterium]|jgi:small subunit ribosomal protein S1|nr:S1 RNA-binding domain-containing protein [Chitinivibrionales bacterium]